MGHITNLRNQLKSMNTFSGVACMYACMLEHPHHFDKKKKKKKKMKKRKRERERSRKIMERIYMYDNPLG